MSSTLSVRRKLRPLRIAFLVRPDDSDAILGAIQASTCVWAGRFNAIIPMFMRTPSWWAKKPSFRPSAVELASGYIQAFEPDYVVETHPDLAKQLKLEHGQVLKPDQILPARGSSRVLHGVSVRELYRDLYERKYQFVRRNSESIYLPKVSVASNLLFSAAVFGAFPAGDRFASFERDYRRAFNAQDVIAEPSNLISLMSAGNPLMMGSVGIDFFRRGGDFQSTILYLDATKLIDVIDFWNLRALGWDVVAAPVGWEQEMADSCKSFIARHFKRDESGRTLRDTRILCSRSVSAKHFEEFLQTIRVPEPGSYYKQDWQPRIWDEWAREYDHADRCSVVVEESEVECSIENDRVTFPTLSPPFTDKFGWSGEPRWANVITLRSSGADGGISVLPSDLREVDRLFDTLQPYSLSVSSEGIVVRCSHNDWPQRWHVPDPVTVFVRWFKGMGLAAMLSGAGKIAAEFMRALGGLWRTRHIASVEVIEQLNNMAHSMAEADITEEKRPRKLPVRGKMVPYDAWWALLQKVNQGNPDAARRDLDWLTERGVLRIGLRLKCSRCSQSNWYPLNALSDELKCERCLSTFHFPSCNPPNRDWCYRSQGPFSVENYAQGGYTVALALSFLVNELHADATWVTSIELQDSAAVKHEADFAMFWRRMKLGTPETFLILGECKSLNEPFKSKDVMRARALAKAFPGAVLVFATLRNELSKREKDALARLARMGRRYLKGERWRAPILVLTAHELFSEMGPPHCWIDVGGKYKTLGEQFRIHEGLLGLCDTTQQLHLDMESFGAWQSQMAKRRKR